MNVVDIINKGTSELDDIIVKRRVVRANAYTLLICISMFFVVVVNLILKNYIISIIVFPNLLLIVANYLYFLRKRNYELYPNVLSLILLYIMLSANILGGVKGFGPFLVDIFILLTSSLLVRKWAALFSSILIIGNFGAYFLGDNISFIYNYQEVVSLEVFIKFSVVHICVASVAYINNKNLELGYKELEFEKNKNKQLFLNLVHDLKTPLTILDNRIDISISKDNSNKDLLSLKQTVDDMSHNIIRIIDLEKKNNNKKSNETANLNVSKETEKIIHSYKSLIEGYNNRLQFNIENKLYIKCSKLDYSKILTNLLDNALKYNSENGIIYISIYSSMSKIILSVRDQGAGIDDKDISRIFEPYTQLERGIKSKYGLGLGLAIVKSICNEIGAIIEVSSSKDTGSTFSIAFNVSKKCNENKSLLQGEIQNNYFSAKMVMNNKKKTLLIVDDHFEMRKLLHQSFIEDFNIVMAKDGNEATYKLNNKIDLIISDVMMPNLDGISFINRIENLKTPVIFISAKSVSDNVLEGLTAGAVDYVTKPFSIKELKLKVKAILNLLENDRNEVVNKITEQITSCISNYNDIEVSSTKESLSILTSKEKEIVEYLLSGISQKDIALKMNLSINTVKSHIQRIYKKYNVHNVTALLSRI